MQPCAPLSVPPLRALPWLAFGSVWAMGAPASLSASDHRALTLMSLLLIGSVIAAAVVLAARARTSAGAVRRFVLVVALGFGVVVTLMNGTDGPCCAPPAFILAPLGAIPIS
jgi:hypothetical protein